MTLKIKCHRPVQNNRKDSKSTRPLATWISRNFYSGRCSFVCFALLASLLSFPIYADQSEVPAAQEHIELLNWNVRGLPSVRERRPNEIIHCLAQEELIIHQRKFGGALYRLNQTLINELVSWNDIHLRPEYIKEVCQGRPFSPSVNLLKVTLLNGKKIFDLNFDDDQDGLLGYQIQEVMSFIDRLPKVFFSYLADLQILVSNPRCFSQKIPEIQYFYERFQYLEVHLSVEALIEEKDKLRGIFEKLKGIDQIVEKCRDGEEKR